jgi:tetratricopeptide (TPR) repeat protein
MLAGRAGTAEDPAFLLARAWQDFLGGEYDMAARGFADTRRAAAKDSPEALLATYGLASVWNLRGAGPDPVRAEALYREVIAAHPKSDAAAWSLLALARMKHVPPAGQEPDYPAVRKAYAEVIAAFPGHAAAEEALMYQQATLVYTLDRTDAEAALAALTAHLERTPASPFASPMWGLVAECHRTLGDATARLRAEIKSLETKEIDPTNPWSDHAWTYWKIATIAEFEAGDFRTARIYYTKFVEEYPTDNRRYGAKKALERMDAALRGAK